MNDPIAQEKLMQKFRWLLAVCIAVGGAVLTSPAAGQQGATITGQVTSELGQGLGSVSVYIPSLDVGAITRADGTYAFTIPAGRFTAGRAVEVQASSIGYQTATQSVTLALGTVSANFQLSGDPLRLQEIVVTGAGLSSRAERLGTARSTVGGDMVTRSNETNIITSLAQKAPNVVTTQSSGEAGASTAVRIRGVSTLSGTGQPTIIVDGVPINNSTRSGGFRGAGGSPLDGSVSMNRAMDINPDDVASIEILKGPAAMSLLGASAGAGGAILITTKRGAAGATTYSLRSTLQLDNPVTNVPLQRTFGSGNQGAPTPCLVSPTPGCTHNNPTWGPRLAPGTPTYDHSAELYEQGRMWDNTLSMSGGSGTTTFYLSLGSLNHDGFIQTDNDEYQRQTVRLNAGHSLRSNLRVGGNFAYAQTSGDFIGRGNNVNGLLLGALRTPPEFDNTQYLDSQYGLHRSYRFPMPRQQDFVNANRGFDNPFFVLNSHEQNSEVGRAFGNLTANWDPFSWLAVNYSLGADFTSDDRTGALHPSAAGAAQGGLLTRWQLTDRILDSNLTATARWTLSDAILGSFSVGQNLNETNMRQVFAQARTFIAPQPYKLENTVSRDPPTDREYRRRLAGYFAQVEVDYADQLFLTGRVRRDGASTFGVDDQYAIYPGGQASWIFSRTLGLADGGPVSFGRFRLAYGESGQEPELYQLQDLFNAGVAIVDFNPGSTLVPTLGGYGGLYTGATLGNPAIRPERVGELEGGIDLSFFDGRSDLEVTHYRSRARDVIFAVDTPPSTGATAQVLNAGEIENVGWEVALNVRPVVTPNFSVDLGVNWATNENEVTGLGDIGPGLRRTVTAYGGGNSFTGSTTHAEVGQPVGIFRGFGWVRCGMGAALTTPAYVTACTGAPVGATYLGANGLPVSDPNERVIGDPNPDWTGGLNAEVTLYGLRLSAFLDHRSGGQTFNMTRGSLQSLGVHANTEIRDAPAAPWESFYPSFADVAGPGVGVPVQLGQVWFAGLGGLGTREHLMEDATHTRLREVSIAYNFTQRWVTQGLGLSGIDARISGRNLKTWTDYTGFDPEVNTGGAAVTNRGIDWFVNPLSRAWVLSVGITR